jgi:CRISPR-associated protein (TIGR02710 family)
MLFKPFSRVNKPEYSETSGTGLGLSISKGLIDVHGGRRWAESKKIETALKLFNNCQYSSVIFLIDDIKKYSHESRLNERLDLLEKISKGYMEWDRFNHHKAFEILKQVKDPRIRKNKAFLGQLISLTEKELEDEEDSEEKKNEYTRRKQSFYLVDLMNNALRRGDIEEKYDDAVARLYRLVEFIAQYRLLEEYDIDTSEIEYSQLPENLKVNWFDQRYEKLQIGMNKAYILLSHLGDSLGSFLADKEIRDLLSKRNHSILAHGMKPVEKEVYEKLKKIVLDKIKDLVPNMEQLSSDSIFVTINQI